MKRFLLLGTLLLLLATLQSALAVPAGGVGFYKFEDDLTNEWNTSSLTWSGGATYSTSVPTFTGSGDAGSKSADFDGSSDQASSTHDLKDSFTLSFWAYAPGHSGSDAYIPVGNWDVGGSADAYGIFLYTEDGFSDEYEVTMKVDGTRTRIIKTYAEGGCNPESAWCHFAMTFNESTRNMSMYVNGVYIDEDTVGAGTFETAGVAYIGSGYSQNYYDGLIDEVQFFTYPLQDYEILALYQNNTIETASPPASINTYTLSVTDLYDDGDLQGVNVTVTGGESNTTDASGDATFYNLTGTLDYNASKAGFFTVAGTIAPNGTSNATMTAGHVNITAITSLISGTDLQNWNFTANTSGGKSYGELAGSFPGLIYLANGSNTITLQDDDGHYFDHNFIVNITAPESTTTTVTGLYNAVLIVNATNTFTGALVSNYTLNVSNTTHAYSASYPTTTGWVNVSAEQGVDLFLLIDATGYAFANTTKSINASPYHEFELYTENSIDIYIYDVDTATLITENMTVTVTGNASETVYYTATGNLYVDLLPDGEYTVKLQNGNYSLVSYTVTVADRSTQTLNAYLSKNTQDVTFTFLDEDTGATLEGVVTPMTRLINSTWTVVSTKTSDITGRSQFSYTPGVKYCFTSSLTNYNTRSYCFDPILFSSYNVEMGKDTLLADAPDYTGVTVTWSPKSFEDNQSVNFTLQVTSPTGVLNSYSYNLSWPGNSTGGSGSNSYGEEFNAVVNIPSVSGFRYVNLTYTYNTTVGEPRSFTFRYLISGSHPSTSMAAVGDNTYGLGILTRIGLVVFLTIIVGGVVSLIAGPLPGGAAGLLIMGYLIVIGFMPLWAGLLSFAVGGLILMVKAT